jgi:hypothetical protein
MRIDLIDIPKNTEKTIKPLWYSFFTGLKKVCARIGTESK